LPVRYVADAVRMWRSLQQARPDVLVVISPPVIAPVVAWLWSALHPCRLVVDCHTGALHWPKWGWTRPLHRLLFRRAHAVLVQTEEDEARLRAWGTPVVLLPDDLPDPSEAAPGPPGKGVPRVVVAGSFDWNEPVAAALVAAALVPEMEVRLTGDVSRLPRSVRAGAPANVVFTGYLPYGQFLGELLAADVVAVFSTDPHIMNRAAFEAVGLGRPLVLSDLPGLRARFGDGAVLCPNDAAAMAEAIRLAQRDRDTLAERSRALRRRLQAQRQAALAQLQTMVRSRQLPAAGARVRSHP
jgi:glycosyltransferase involved in cell wall biosynthesis